MSYTLATQPQPQKVRHWRTMFGVRAAWENIETNVQSNGFVPFEERPASPKLPKACAANLSKWSIPITG